jgi:hypothetical protein
MKSLAALMILSMILLLEGCATYTVKDGAGNILEQGQAAGFGRDMVHTKTTISTTTIEQGLPVTQTVSTDSISSTSNVANVLSATNQILGTLVDAAGKFKP